MTALKVNLIETRGAMLRAPTEENRLAYRVCFAAWLSCKRGETMCLTQAVCLTRPL